MNLEKQVIDLNYTLKMQQIYFFQIDNLKKLGLYSEDEQPKQN